MVTLPKKYSDYLYSRGLSDATIETFGIGACDTFGRCTHPEYLPLIDFRFHDTVLFPIRNVYNDLVAIGSRSVDAKMYVHSKYSKRQHLFGLNIAYPEIFKTRKVFVVEGNFDLLTCYEHGIKNVVAMLGSKLSIEQLSLLVRFADEIVIASDSDEPGQECARKIATLCRENSIKYRKLNLPTGSDPDSLIRAKGADAFLRLQSTDPLERLKESLWKEPYLSNQQ